jgi:hypothetical protein
LRPKWLALWMSIAKRSKRLISELLIAIVAEKVTLIGTRPSPQAK